MTVPSTAAVAQMKNTHSVAEARAQRPVDLLPREDVRRLAWLLFIMAIIAALAGHAAPGKTGTIGAGTRAAIRAVVGDISGGALSDLDEQARELGQAIDARGTDAESP
jgi:hypothetical protein